MPYIATLTNSPSHHRIRIELAWTLARRDRHEEAISMLRESCNALHGTSYERTALERLVHLLERQQRWNDAAPYRARLTELDSEMDG